jgi:D-alanyl-D-alanine carboxypeptidase/D-alanyl-D-alanine-endopeptidase (penicillin-binding protein 4)
LSFNENTYVLFFKPGDAVGDVAEFLRTEPAMPDITFVNEMRTGSRSSGDNGFVYGAPYTYVRHLRGTVPMGGEFSIKGSIPEPALFAAQSLKSALEQAGISVEGQASTERLERLAGKAAGKERSTLYTHQSPPLKEIIYWLNKKSVNLYAEHLLKMMGHVKYKDGSTESGVKAVEAYWTGKGIDIGGMHLNDGSGLSRYNGITPAQLAGMLRLNANEPWFEHFWNSLPVAGDADDPGTLRSMCKGTAAEGKVHAKSGYISRVRTYAGYVDSRSGQRLAFAMMANNYTCTNAQIKTLLEGLMVVLAEM